MGRTTTEPPLLVIVSGAPGSGKTTLARQLGETLMLPVITKDGFKEVLYDTLGAGDAAWSARLGEASFTLLFTTAERLLAAGTGVMIEANFYPGVSEERLAVLAKAARGRMIHCEGDPEMIIRRYRERAERGERHPGHRDAEAVSRLRASLAEGRFDPPLLNLPLLRVDTTTAAAYAPPLAGITGFITGAPAHPESHEEHLPMHPGISYGAEAGDRSAFGPGSGSGSGKRGAFDKRGVFDTHEVRDAPRSTLDLGG